MDDVITALYSGSFQPNKPITQLIKNLNTNEINVAESAKVVPNEKVINQVMLREKELNEDYILAQRVAAGNERRDTYVEIVRNGNIERENKKGRIIDISV